MAVKRSAAAIALMTVLFGIIWIPATAGQAEPIDPPIRIPRPQPASAILEGTVMRVDLRVSPPRLSVLTDGTTAHVVIGPQTSIFVSETSSGHGGAAGVDQIRRGDWVRITLDEHLRARLISASHREVTGRLAWIRSGSIRLAGGQAFRLAAEPLLLLDNHVARPEAFRRGMAVTLRVHPRTGEVWEVRARTPAARVPFGSFWDPWNEFLPS